jgi:hypothetical protein
MDLGLPGMTALPMLISEVSLKESGTYIPQGTINLPVLHHPKLTL